MNVVENRLKYLREQVKEAKSLVDNRLEFFKDMKRFGEFYEDNVGNEDVSDSDLVDIYFQAYRQYDDEREWLRKARDELKEFKEISKQDGFEEEYEKLTRIQTMLAKRTNNIFKETKRRNCAFIFPNDVHNWFSLGYTKEQWGEYIHNTKHIINKDKFMPVIEIIQMGNNFQFNETTPEDGIPEITFRLTTDNKESIVHTVDLTDIIKPEYNESINS